MSVVVVAVFAAEVCWVTPAARGNCCWSALLAAAANLHCGVQLLQAVACSCCCCCGSWPGPFPWGYRCHWAAVKLLRLSFLGCCFSTRFLLGFLPGLLPLAAAAGWGGLLERVNNSPSGRCTTVNRAVRLAGVSTHTRYRSKAW